MRKVNYILIIAICVILNFLSVVNAKTTDRNFPPPLRATYDTPAKIWESEALPIGNGYMGAMIFGRSEERRVGKECRSRWSPYH